MFTFPVGLFGGAQTIDPFWGNTTLYLPLTGTNGQTTFPDVSQYTHAIVRNGNTVISTAQFPPLTGVNSSASFDGAGDYLGVPYFSVLDLTSGDFTIEFYLKPSNTTSGQVIFDLYRSALVPTGIVITQPSSDPSKIRFACGDSNTTAFEVDIISSASISTTAWHYVAITRSGSTFTLRLNGASVGSAVWGGTINNAAPNITIGAARDGSLGFTGNLSHIRITKGVARDVSVVPTAPFPIG